MWAIIGSIVVLVCVIGGYLLSHGNLAILIQPYEMMIIFGAATGAFLTSAGTSSKDVVKAAVNVLKGKHIGKEDYLQALAFFYDMATVARKEGFLALEAHVDAPNESAIFSKYPKFKSDERILSFACENIKLSTFVKMETNELGALMDVEIDTILAEEEYPSQILTKIGDSLPGLGIVAAVLGVILTMGFLAEPAEIIGHHVAVALVGTFVGILACYGFVGPIANAMEHYVHSRAAMYNVLKVCIANLVTGSSPAVLVELGRRAVPPHYKPTVTEIEELSSGKAGA